MNDELKREVAKAIYEAEDTFNCAERAQAAYSIIYTRVIAPLEERNKRLQEALEHLKETTPITAQRKYIVEALRETK